MKKVTIAIPIAETNGAEPIRHIEARLTPEQGRTLQQIRDALNAACARQADGRFVQSNADAVRWMIEAVGAESIN